MASTGFVAPASAAIRGKGVRVSSARVAARTPARVVTKASLADEILAPPALPPPGEYCESYARAMRRPTRTVWIGKVPVGSEHPIALQTMTTSDTRDVQKTVEEVMRVADAGADICRITVQGNKEADACMEIREKLFQYKYDIPLVADIHFAPKIAMRVADAFEKIRINPGNFADGRKTFDVLTYEDENDYKRELEEIEEVFTPLVLKCKELGRAMRIGTNHGSLSARILSYYGDTPAGMVESAFEFARICRKHDYHNFVFSMKASNPLVMVQAYRLLAAEMYRLGWDYPLHLGVTEAGEGEDGRMKSSIGIGALLLDGLGDTIRVSLTEAPELEIDPCRRLAQLGTEAVTNSWGIDDFAETQRDFKTFARREVILPEQRESDAVDFRGLLHRDGSVLTAVTTEQLENPEPLYVELGCKLAVGMPFKDIATSDSILLKEVPTSAVATTALRRLQESNVGVLVPKAELEKAELKNSVALFTLAEAKAQIDASGSVQLPGGAGRLALSLNGTESAEDIEYVTKSGAVMVLLNPERTERLQASRRIFEELLKNKSEVPVIHHITFPADADKDTVVMESGSMVGGLLVDALGEGVCIDAPLSTNELRTISFGLLQGSRMRNTKTEFVSCPSCGRTLFDLQEVTAMIQERTGHLPGVSIAIMGCIVNGPGEMADADFGYVGGAPGKVDLYVGKEVVKRGIPNENACDQLVELIKEHGRWVEKDEDAEAEVAA